MSIMDNIESQEMELLALQNIYEEKDFTMDETDPHCGRFVVNVRLPQPFSVKYEVFKNKVSPDETKTYETQGEVFEVEHLPPINLFFQFPSTYPSDTVPAFLLSCNWLTRDQLSRLCKHLESLWSNDVVLYTWFQFLQDETLDFLNISQCLDVTELLSFKIKDNFQFSNRTQSDSPIYSETSGNRNASNPNIVPSITGGFGAIDSRSFNDLPDGKILVQLLKDYNEYKKEDVFKKAIHTCDICLLPKSGLDFITFKLCRHSFCRDCVKSYFESQIRDGNVNSLNCPQGECSTQADGSVVKELVTSDLFEKYDRLLLLRTLEDMDDITYCPRKDCQCPVLIDTCGTIGSCTACQFVFCPRCNMAYHGVAACNFKSEQKQVLFEKYVNGDEETKWGLEKQFGKREIKAMIEDILSEKWKTSNSKNCPSCHASIEKTDGCNKMTCFRCGSYFCWLCNEQLRSTNPYFHYSDRNSECNNKLFPDDALEFEPGEFLEDFF